MATTAAIDRKVMYSRLELPPHQHERLRAAADRDRRSIASYIRIAVLDRISAGERAAETAGEYEPVVHIRPRVGPKSEA
jgi:predicted DNA-binding protein